MLRFDHILIYYKVLKMKNSDLYQSYPLSVYNSVCRSLCKFLYKYTHPKSYKHNRYYWPFIV